MHGSHAHTIILLSPEIFWQERSLTESISSQALDRTETRKTSSSLLKPFIFLSRLVSIPHDIEKSL